MTLLTALLLLSASFLMSSPEPPENVMTVAVYRNYTAILDNGELVTILDDGCRDPRISNTNAHTCNGDIDLLIEMVDGYLPLPYEYAENIIRWQP